jgi:hypothetical protein
MSKISRIEVDNEYQFKIGDTFSNTKIAHIEHVNNLSYVCWSEDNEELVRISNCNVIAYSFVDKKKEKEQDKENPFK